MSTDNIKHSAESYLDTCALGYAAVVAGQADTGEPFTPALVVETIDSLLLISSPERIGKSAP